MILLMYVTFSPWKPQCETSSHSLDISSCSGQLLRTPTPAQPPGFVLVLRAVLTPAVFTVTRVTLMHCQNKISYRCLPRAGSDWGLSGSKDEDSITWSQIITLSLHSCLLSWPLGTTGHSPWCSYSPIRYLHILTGSRSAFPSSRLHTPSDRCSYPLIFFVALTALAQSTHHQLLRGEVLQPKPELSALSFSSSPSVLL